MLFVVLCTAVFPAPSTAQEVPPTPRTVSPRDEIVLANAPCIVAVDPKDGSTLEIARNSQNRDRAIFRAPATTTTTPIVVAIDTSDKTTVDDKGIKTGCEAPTRQRFAISVTAAATQEIPPGAPAKAFTILMMAFLLAVLLESAFAWLFQWRVFLEFFVSKAWQAPIMLIGALIVVYAFDFDLMRRLIDAYNPGEKTGEGYGWFTGLLTAMILAGGSAGVNRLFTTLGFRSQLRPEDETPALEPEQAYVAIQVRAPAAKADFQVNMDVVTPIPPDVPRVVGFVGRANNAWSRLVELLFPMRTRVPRSGGLRVSTLKAYRISVTDLSDGTRYNTHGRPVTTPEELEVVSFAPKAIVDFIINIAPKKEPAI